MTLMLMMITEICNAILLTFATPWDIFLASYQDRLALASIRAHGCGDHSEIAGPLSRSTARLKAHAKGGFLWNWWVFSFLSSEAFICDLIRQIWPIHVLPRWVAEIEDTLWVNMGIATCRTDEPTTSHPNLFLLLRQIYSQLVPRWHIFFSYAPKEFKKG